MKDYFGTGMRLYLDHLIDWETFLTLRSGEGVDVEAEVGAYRTILETVRVPRRRLREAGPGELGRRGGAHARTAARPRPPTCGRPTRSSERPAS